MRACCAVQVDFPVEPGDRLMLQVVEVDVPSGHYRLTVTVGGSSARWSLQWRACARIAPVLAENSWPTTALEA